MYRQTCRRTMVMALVLATFRGHRAWASTANGPKDAAHDIKLVLLIVVDQMRADLLSRFDDHFGPDGFKRLIDHGAYFPNAYFSYGATSTAVGHATIASGRLPRRHGIINNEWHIDPQGTKARHIVYDPDTRLVGLAAGEDKPGFSPRYLIGSTLGDQMKLADRRSRVMSASIKHRAAIMMGGQRPDLVLWWDRDTGRFVTSTYYGPSVPPYVVDFNEKRWCDRYIGKTWERLLPESAYVACQVNAPSWLGFTYGLGPRFPHALPKVEGTPTITFYNAMYACPFGNETLAEMTKRIATVEKPGSGPAPDLFCVSYSCNDVCGHVFGPDSEEIMDITVRTDRMIAELLGLIDKQVGLDHCLVLLTADHGVKELPPLAAAHGLGAGYFDAAGAIKLINKTLADRFGDPANGRPYITGIEMPWLWFDRSFYDYDVDRQMQLMFAVADALSEMQGVEQVFTAADLEDAPPSPVDSARYLAWRCYYPERSGEIYIHLAPQWSVKSDDENTGHGTAHSMDRHVPIILAGPHIEPGRYPDVIDPVDIVPTIATLLGIEPPADAVGRVLSEAIDAN